MRKHILSIILLVMSCQGAIAATPSKLFEVTLEDVQGGGRVLDVVFYGKLPAPKIVDKIVRESLDHAVLIDSTVDILAMGFLDDDKLNSNQSSGDLVYKAAQKKVITFDEYRGLKTTTSTTGTYFIEVQEDHTYAGIKPERKWLNLTIVFPTQPTREVAYNTIFAESAKLATKGLDINAYVSVGDKSNKTSWKQMKDADGAFVFAQYNAASKRIMRKGEVLKQL